mgnify:CR=1 FL=1
MELYFAPLACSMATRIALYEAGAEARFTQVDTRARRVSDGSDYLAINPLGQVPVLRSESGQLLTENPVVLQHVAEAYPQAGLMPADPAGRLRLQQWLGFITTELHKLVFSPLLDPKAPEGARTYAKDKAVPRFDHLERELAGRDFLLDRFSIADAYLVTVLNWSSAAGIDLGQWPAVNAYRKRLLQRPAVARAVTEERAL